MSCRNLSAFRVIAPTILCIGVASSASAGFLSNYQFIFREDLDANSRFHGSTLVGNDLSASAGIGEFGVDEKGRFLFPASGDSLTVVNDVVSGTHRTLNGNATVNAVVAPATLVANGSGATVTELGYQQDLAAIFQDYIEISASLSSEAPSGTTSFSGGELTLSGSGALDCEFFNVDINTLFSLNNLSFSNIGPATEIFINVSGAVLDFGTSALLGLANDEELRSRVVWNFYEATEINIEGGRDFYGSILAPNADLTATQQIWGDIFAKSGTIKNQMHAQFFDGWKLSPIPEPSTVLSLMTTFLIGCLLTKRR